MMYFFSCFIHLYESIVLEIYCTPYLEHICKKIFFFHLSYNLHMDVEGSRLYEVWNYIKFFDKVCEEEYEEACIRE